MNYTRWRTELDNKFPGWEIVNRFHPLPLEAELSDNELETVRNTNYVEALRNGDASAPDDFEEWRDLDLPDREE